MNIKTLIEAINPSKTILTWMVVASVASIPTVWLLSGKISSKRVLEDNRLHKLEMSVESIDTKVTGLYTKFDNAEQRFTTTYENGVTEVGNIIKESDRKQTNQLKFVIDNWTEENRILISNALEIRQNENEAELNRMIDKAKQPPVYKSDVWVYPIDEEPPKVYKLENVGISALDTITGKYKILDVELLKDSKYNIEFRDFISYERIN